jgi:hypothetical protein
LASRQFVAFHHSLAMGGNTLGKSKCRLAA